MEIKVQINFLQLEQLKEIDNNKLVGGFSSSFSSFSSFDNKDESANNCLGGNCRIGCGSGQNIQCNTTAGCGE